ncbi:Lrp/AsnC family transcriptional regulator [Chloroflexota bacterium]
MDEIDLQILQTLQQDGRTPFTKIAKQTGVSESTIRSRYATLVEEGVVNTVSIVDPFALGFQAPAVIGVSVEAGKLDQVGKEILEFPEVSYQVMVLGSYDLVIEVFCKDLAHLTKFITANLQSVPGVKSTETLMIAKIYKLSYRWSPEFDSQDVD